VISTYYTYRALVNEWRDLVVGGSIEEAFSQVPGELVLRIASGPGRCALVFHPAPPDRYLFRRDDFRRRGRNVADVLSAALGQQVASLSIAERDRVLTFYLSGGKRLVFVLFGSQANVLLADAAGRIEDAFLHPGSYAGKELPGTRSASGAAETTDLTSIPSAQGATSKALRRAIPLFDTALAEETVRQCKDVPRDAAACTDSDLADLLAAARELELEALSPQPGIRSDGQSAQFTLVSERSSEPDVERFSSVDEAVREFWIRRLREAAADRVIGPFLSRLEREAARLRRSVERMEEQLASGGRGDQYERYGHLLMTVSSGGTRGLEVIRVDDVFADGAAIEIPLDAERSVRENAARFYERARQSRGAREFALSRLDGRKRQLESILGAIEAARTVASKRDADQFVKEHTGLIPGRESGDGGRHMPGHRFDLGGGALVVVGRNAKENDAITFGFARKEDLWMHARGYPGSHVVLRVASRTLAPPKAVIEAAASVAAYFSKARGSELVPVIVVPRKYVRKARGGAAGQVVVEREKVILVPPKLPVEEE
jgi:predicted ribosome quality control (RQC) complex YloA/Tae2 family protein